MIIKIDHLNIVVEDLEANIEFFSLFGFEQVSSGVLQGDWIDQVVGLKDVQARYCALEIAGQPTKLELIKYFSPLALQENASLQRSNQNGFRHMAFEVVEIEKEVARLKSRGVKLFSEIKIYPATGKKLIYFYGPEGIILELAEYPAVSS